MSENAASELESLRRQIAEVERRSHQEIDSLREQLQVEIGSLEQLHETSLRLAEQRDLHDLLGEVLDAAIAITAATMGNVQLLSPSGDLHIAAHRGFDSPFLEFFRVVRGNDTACGLSMIQGKRVIVNDVLSSPIFADTDGLKVILDAGVRAVQSTPLISRSGTVIGMFSTHYHRPHQPNDRELRLLDHLARQAAALIEKAQTEQALRESERRFRDLADSAPVMIWVSGLDKKCTWFNKPWLEFTGRTMEQEIGDGWAEAVHPEDIQACLATYMARFDRRETFRMEYRLRRHDGNWGWVLDHGTPMVDSAGTFLGYIGSCIEITDFKRAQEEALARQKLESLGVLTSGIAHDFNNLLGSILAEAEVSEATLASGLSPADGLARIKAVALRAAEIVRELMIYAGQDTAKPESLDLSQLVHEMLELLKASISKHAVLNSDLPTGLPAIRADAAQIRQVVMNLVLNASEALEGKDGLITLSVSPVVATADLNGPQALRLVVADTGTGISSDLQSKIFDPFFSTKFAGRGLGLAVVKTIVGEHNGSISFVSSSDKGTTFEIQLPCDLETTQRGGKPSDRRNAERLSDLSRSVLVVEDETELRVAVGKLLRRRGFSVVEAGDGTAALECLRAAEQSFDAMILDLTLPGVSSRDVFEQARRLRSELKVILTSAHSKETVDSTLGLPVEHFVRKPFRVAGLIELLEDIVS